MQCLFLGNKRKIKALEENDYYDSDEDNYFDRTGDGKMIIFTIIDTVKTL